MSSRGWLDVVHAFVFRVRIGRYTSRACTRPVHTNTRVGSRALDRRVVFFYCSRHHHLFYDFRAARRRPPARPVSAYATTSLTLTLLQEGVNEDQVLVMLLQICAVLEHLAGTLLVAAHKLCPSVPLSVPTPLLSICVTPMSVACRKPVPFSLIDVFVWLSSAWGRFTVCICIASQALESRTET